MEDKIKKLADKCLPIFNKCVLDLFLKFRHRHTLDELKSFFAVSYMEAIRDYVRNEPSEAISTYIYHKIAWTNRERYLKENVIWVPPHHPSSRTASFAHRARNVLNFHGRESKSSDTALLVHDDLDRNIVIEECTNVVQELFRFLPPRQKLIVKLAFGIPVVDLDIGKTTKLESDEPGVDEAMVWRAKEAQVLSKGSPLPMSKIARVIQRTRSLVSLQINRILDKMSERAYKLGFWAIHDDLVEGIEWPMRRQEKEHAKK